MLVANDHGMQFSSTGSQSSPKAHVTDSNNYGFSRDSISDFTEENIDYDIDASASILLINMSHQSPNDYMPKEDSSALSPEVRQIWSKIPNDMKAVMFRSRTGNCNDGANNHNKNVCIPQNFLLTLLRNSP